MIADDTRQLDSRYYERGIEARRNAHTALTDVESVLDEVEDQADRLLADLSNLIEGRELT